MALADEIRDLGTQSQETLDELLDYYSHTKVAWRVVQNVVKAGRKFNITNRSTGTTYNERDLVGRSQRYIVRHLAVSTYKQTTAVLEDFYFALQRLWLADDPRSLSPMSITFGELMEADSQEAIKHKLIGVRLQEQANEAALDRFAGSQEAIKFKLIDKRLHNQAYESVGKWFSAGNQMMKLGLPTADQIAQIAELKATRDVLEHRRGVVDALYRVKAGARRRYENDGERVEVSEPYLRDSWTLIRTVIEEITTAAAQKAEAKAAAAMGPQAGEAPAAPPCP